MASYAVAGATSWGATLAWLLHGNGHEVTLIARTAAEADAVRTAGGVSRLPELKLPGAITVEGGRARPDGQDGLVLAAPVQSAAE